MALTNLTANIKHSFSATGAADYGLQGISNPLREAIEQVFSFGTGSDQINELWHGTIELDSGGTASVEIDLYGGALSNPAGDGVVLSKVKALLIRNTSSKSTGASLYVSGGAANKWDVLWGSSDKIVVPKGATVMWILPGDGVAVGAASKTVKFEHAMSGDAALDVEVALIGVGT